MRVTRQLGLELSPSIDGLESSYARILVDSEIDVNNTTFTGNLKFKFQMTEATP